MEPVGTYYTGSDAQYAEQGVKARVLVLGERRSKEWVGLARSSQCEAGNVGYVEQEELG